MKNILAEKIWPVVQPILQKEKYHAGRPEYNAKNTFLGIMYVLENGIKWRCLPSEYGKVSTIHGKFMRWIREGKIQDIFEKVRNEYLLVTDTFKNWYAVNTSYCKASYAKNGGKNPTNRGKRGVKKNIAVDSAYDAKDFRSEALKDGFILHASTNKHRNQNEEILKPKDRWKVEATHSWFNNFRSLKIC